MEGPVFDDRGGRPHELAHANDIRRRFANRHVTNGQIVLFGLTSGLIALGATLVASGVIAALGVKHTAKRWSGCGEFARTAPYFSSLLIAAVGLYMGYQGSRALV